MISRRWAVGFSFPPTEAVPEVTQVVPAPEEDAAAGEAPLAATGEATPKTESDTEPEPEKRGEAETETDEVAPEY